MIYCARIAAGTVAQVTVEPDPPPPEVIEE